MAQTTVNRYIGYGVVGEIFDSGPHRAQPFTLNSASATNNVFGRAFSKTATEGVAAVGNTTGALVFAGIMVNPKEHISRGDAVNPLNPSLTLPNGEVASMLTMGSVFVTLPAAAAIGDRVIFDNTTGILATIAAGAALPVGKSFAQAVVDRFIPTEAGLAVITLTPTLITPVLA